jgi:O-antigen ligase
MRAFAKYGKLLLIPLALVLLRTRKQALYALLVYIALQSFVVMSSWLLFFGFKLPYIPAGRNHFTVVFSSSLDQAILTAGFVVLCWHLAKEFPSKYGRHLAWFLAAFGTLNIVFALYGRTGQICLLAAISLTAFWALSKKMRVAAFILPFVLLYGATAVSPQFKSGIFAIKNEVLAYKQSKGEKQLTSSGLRMEFWERSIEITQKEPLTGYGLGSWKQQYDLAQQGNTQQPTFGVGNPHQEFLLIGVQLGILGLALFIGWIASMAWHARQYDTTASRATQCFLAVFVVASMFNSALYDGLVGDYFVTILGLLLALGANPKTADGSPVGNHTT